LAPQKDGAKLGDIELSIGQMRENAVEILKYCDQVIRILHKVYIEQKLEIPDEAFSSAADSKPTKLKPPGANRAAPL
jgi:hypothetical protein